MQSYSNSNIASEIVPPLFIMGCMRSGTTLVSQIFSSHSRIAVFHETYYYTFFRPELHYYGDLGQPPNLMRFITDVLESIRVQQVNPPEIEEFRKALVAPTFEGVLTTLLHLYARSQGKVRGGDKTPTHHVYLSEILEKFPESPVIFIIRDPRDTVLSLQKAFGTSIDGGARLWNDTFLSYSNASQDVYLVRYEELVQKPTEVVKAICSFIGEPYEPTMLRFFELIPERLHGRYHLRKLFEPMNATSVGNFRQMSTRDIERIEAACAEGMEAMGYPFTTRLATRPGVVNRNAPRILSFLSFLLDRLHYYRWDKGRWRAGWFRWKIVFRARARYWLTLMPLRNRR